MSELAIRHLVETVARLRSSGQNINERRLAREAGVTQRQARQWLQSAGIEPKGVRNERLFSEALAQLQAGGERVSVSRIVRMTGIPRAAAKMRLERAAEAAPAPAKATRLPPASGAPHQSERDA
jgi:hypothetical protein